MRSLVIFVGGRVIVALVAMPSRSLLERQRYEHFDLVSWTPERVNKKVLTVVLPGNPGLCDFYSDVARDICALTQTRTTVVGWLGFRRDVPLVAKLPCFELEAQIEHARQTIGVLARDYDAVALVGHSIGALIALECLVRPTKRVAAVAAVAPFVASPSDPKYGKKRLALFLPGFSLLVVALALCVRILPVRWRARILSCAHMDADARTLALDAMTRPANVYEMLRMGKSEFESPRIINGPDWSWLAQHKAKVAAIYATGTDAWVRPEAPSQMRENGVEVQFIDADHDFCTRTNTSRACARVVADAINRRLD